MSPRLYKFSKPLFIVLLIAVPAIVALCPADAWQTAAHEIVSVARGKALFTGAEPLVGRIREHQDDMPPAVVTCSNCHASHTQSAVKGSDAPILSAAFLNDRRSRRHGPESAYNERSFCRVMRTSMDPVYVLLDHTMPAYQISDAQCESLWRFLQSPEENVNNPAGSHQP